MIIQKPYSYVQDFLPNSRCKKERSRVISDKMDIEIPELASDDFPLAFKVSNYDFRGEDNDGTKTKVDEIRTYLGELYRRSEKYGRGNTDRDTPVTPEDLPSRIDGPRAYAGTDCILFTRESIVLRDNKMEAQKIVRNAAKRFVLFDGYAWEKCQEPAYYVRTFGFGGGHGGTALFTDFFSNNDTNQCYNALQREMAIKHAYETSRSRGDSEDFSDFATGKVGIEVLMPEMVKLEPHREEYTITVKVSGTVEVKVLAKSQEDANSMANCLSVDDLKKATLKDIKVQLAEEA